MTIRPRWKKLWRDLQSAYGRMLMIVIAIAISLMAVGTILGDYTILTREVSRNYLGTNPAAALIEVDKADNMLVQAIRKRPEIAAAEAGAILSARAEVEPDHWLPMTLFVIENFNAMQISTFQPEAGAWPPPTGTILVERTAIYLVLVAVLGLLAVALGMPLGMLAGRGLARIVAQLLNFTLYSEAIPLWAFATQGAAGILLPLLITVVPIMRFARATMRESLQDFGVSSQQFGDRSFDRWLGRLRFFDRGLLFALRNTFRRRTRLVLTLSLLALAGAVFLAALNVRAAWQKNLDDAKADRRYDMEIRLNQPQDEAEIVPLIAQVAGVAQVEVWNFAPAAAFRADGLDLVRTYPDGGHASFTLRSMPADSTLVRLTLLAGRLLQPGETGSVVLNHMAGTRFSEAQVGQRLSLTANGQPLDLLVVGIVRELSTPATAYVTAETFATTFALPGQANALRVVFDDESIAQSTVVRTIEQGLSQNKVNVKLAISEALLAEAIDGHALILIVMLLAMALIMAVVGLLGLTSAIGTSVIERTREFGVMRAIGARSRTIQRNVISESLFIGLMSWGLAIGLSLPLSLLVGRVVGGLAFGLPLPLVISPVAFLVWLLLISVGSVLASLYPAKNAARFTIRETLAYV